MPLTTSAKKALRQSRRKAKINKPIKSWVKTAMARVRKSPTVENLRQAYSLLDRAAKKRVIKKEKANRLKGRLSNLVNKSLK